jgi:hypothetical protein
MSYGLEPRGLTIQQHISSHFHPQEFTKKKGKETLDWMIAGQKNAEKSQEAVYRTRPAQHFYFIVFHSAMASLLNLTYCLFPAFSAFTIPISVCRYGAFVILQLRLYPGFQSPHPECITIDLKRLVYPLQGLF